MFNKTRPVAPKLSDEAIHLLAAQINHKNDADWAPTIKLMASLDPKVARKRLMQAK